MQPRKPLTKEEALAIAADALREVGLEREAVRLEQSEHVAYLLNYTPSTSDYDERVCASCDVNLYREGEEDSEAHKPECNVLKAWQALNDPRYVTNERVRAERDARLAREKAERAEYERTRCTARGTDTRCRLREGHGGVHDFPMGMTGLNGLLRQIYSPERLAAITSPPLFGVDRAADPVRLTGDVTSPELTVLDIVNALPKGGP